MKKMLLNSLLVILMFFGFTNLVTAVSVSTAEQLTTELKKGGEVKLTADIKELVTIEIPEGITATLDLNGHSIQAGLKSQLRHYYAIDNYGTFTLKDSAGNGYISARGIENLGSGKMTIESGEIRSIDTNGGASIWNEATLVINGGLFTTTHVGTPSDNVGVGCLNNSGKATINGGTFRDVNRRTYAVISSGEIIINNNPIIAGAHGGLGIDSGTATINGGNYSSDDYYGLYVSNDGMGTNPEKATVVVNDGTFDGKTYSVWIGSDVNDPVNSTIEINGGLYKKSVNVESKVHDGGIDIKGGTFQGDLKLQQGGNQESIKVTGGNFLNTNINSYVQSGYSIYKTNDYYVVDKDSNLTISKDKIYLKVGETYEEVYKTLSTKYVSVNLSKANIIKIDKNDIIAQEPGKVTLDITLNNLNNSITKKVEVVVYDVKPVSVDTGLLEDVDVKDDSQNKVQDTLNKVIESILSSSTNIQGVSKELSNSIKESINDGKEISSKIVIKETEESNFEDEIKSINDKIGKNKKIANYYDISIVVTANGNSIGNITEFDNGINITLPIPSDLPKVKNGYKRIYTVVRVHDGKVTELETTENDDNTVSFKSDKYSLFALSYEDISMSALDDVPNTGYSKSSKIGKLIILVLVLGIFAKVMNTNKSKKKSRVR